MSLVLLAYGLNFYYLTYRSTRNTRRHQISSKQLDGSYPLVTVQLPIFNERYVADRLIQAVCKIDYPSSRLEIQVLDDSTDDTGDICKRAVDRSQEEGINISYIHREKRTGFKAGALAEALPKARGELIAIFDADFVPRPDFLVSTLPYFADDEVGMVQTQWGHLNEDYSTLTHALGLNLDAHFRIEQKAKGNSELFMNFNGTAGVWRKTCILDAGGWEYTLAEDLDLSFRAQMKKWRFIFLEDHISPAELPVQMSAARRQQFRWAKGAAQCVRKFLRKILIGDLKLNTKIQAFFQLTRHIVFPLSISSLVLLPFLIWWRFDLSPITGIVSQLTLGPLGYFYALRKMYGQDWTAKIGSYLFLLLFGEGIALTNTVALFEGLLKTGGDFERTPKHGIVSRKDSWQEKQYILPFSWYAFGELCLAAYGGLVILVALLTGGFLLIPIVAIQMFGFLYVSLMTIQQSLNLPRRNGS